MAILQSLFHYTYTIGFMALCALAAKSWRPVTVMGTVTEHNMDSALPLRTATDGMENRAGYIVLTYTKPLGFKAYLKEGVLATRREVDSDVAGPTEGIFGADEALHAMHHSVKELQKAMVGVSGHAAQGDALSRADHRFKDRSIDKISFVTHNDETPIHSTHYSPRNQMLYMTPTAATNFIGRAPRLGGHMGVDMVF